MSSYIIHQPLSSPNINCTTNPARVFVSFTCNLDPQTLVNSKKVLEINCALTILTSLAIFLLLWRHQRRVCQVNRKEYYSKQISPKAFTIQSEVPTALWEATKAAHERSNSRESLSIYFSSALRQYL